LAPNLSRISLANQKLNNEKISGEKNSCDAHFEVGKAVRDIIDKVGGTLPENLPTLRKIYKRIIKRRTKQIYRKTEINFIHLCWECQEKCVSN